MQKLLDDVWKEDEFIGEIDRIEKLLRPHLHDSQRNAPRAMDDVREFIRSRRGELEKELADWPADVSPEPRKPMYAVPVGELTGTFNAEWHERAPTDPTSTGNAKLKLQLNESTITLKNTGASVQEFQFPRFGLGGGGLGGNTKPPVTLVLAGNKADGQLVTVSLFVDRGEFENSNEEAMDVAGMLTEGQNRGFGFGGPGNKSVSGQLWLQESGTNNGDVVKGSITLKITEVHGGFFNRPPPRPATRRPPATNALP
jgi:hypothetical protein